jgi:hypothetical protein
LEQQQMHTSQRPTPRTFTYGPPRVVETARGTCHPSAVKPRPVTTKLSLAPRR